MVNAGAADPSRPCPVQWSMNILEAVIESFKNLPLANIVRTQKLETLFWNETRGRGIDVETLCNLASEKVELDIMNMRNSNEATLYLYKQEFLRSQSL